MSKYSFSQTQTYIQCPLKYRYKYVDRIPTDFVETADIVLGKVVHSTLERLYDDINNFKTPSLVKLLDHHESLRKRKEEEAQREWGEIQLRKDYSLDDYKNRGKNYISTYYKNHTPFDDIKVVDTELSFVFKLGDNINFQWVVDRLDKVDDTFVISDYKTNKRLPTEDKESLIEQLTLYGIGIQQKYNNPNYEIQRDSPGLVFRAFL